MASAIDHRESEHVTLQHNASETPLAEDQSQSGSHFKLMPGSSTKIQDNDKYQTRQREASDPFQNTNFNVRL